MKFKINYPPTNHCQSLLPPHPQDQNMHNTQLNYFSQGNTHPITQLLRSLQNIFTQAEDEDDRNVTLMMQMDEQMGSISIGVMKGNEQPVQQMRPNYQNTIAAIKQYQHSQRELMQGLRQNWMRVKRNRLFYEKYMEKINKQAPLALANQTIINLIQLLQPPQPVKPKNRILPQDTCSHSHHQHPHSSQSASTHPDHPPSINQPTHLNFQQFVLHGDG